MMFLILLLTLSSLPASGRQETGKRKLSNSEAKAVLEAVEDEIYDYGYQKHFYQMGVDVGTPLKDRSRLRIYIEPEVRIEDGEGRAIYKLMPYGEVLRLFYIHKGGLVVLDGDPDLGFPPTQPSLKTVYMDDDEVCRMKHNWLRRFFVVDDSPSPSRIQDAVQRQKLRTGFSDWEYTHSKANKKHE